MHRAQYTPERQDRAAKSNDATCKLNLACAGQRLNGLWCDCLPGGLRASMPLPTARNKPSVPWACAVRINSVAPSISFRMPRAAWWNGKGSVGMQDRMVLRRSNGYNCHKQRPARRGLNTPDLAHLMTGESREPFFHNSFFHAWCGGGRLGSATWRLRWENPCQGKTNTSRRLLWDTFP